MIKLPKILHITPVSVDTEIIRLTSRDTYSLSESCSLVSTDPLVISDGDTKICFIKTGEPSPEGFDFVLECQHKPTFKKIVNQEIKIIRWLKHPSFLDYTPSEIIESWHNGVHYCQEDPEKNRKGFRKPQLAALHCFIGNAIAPKETGVIVMPTGTGKTETMLASLVALPCRKLLCIVPSDALRNQIAYKFVSLGVLPEFGLVEPNALLPSVGIVRNKLSKEQWEEVLTKSNVIVATMTLLCDLDAECKKLLFDNITQIFVDEAHHSEARTWSNFLSGFNPSIITLFTATPFRNDGKKLTGKFLYVFSLKEAQEQGYYKTIDFIPVNEWNDKKSDMAIATRAVEKLKADLSSKHDHILMARCETKKRASEVYKLYSDNWPELNPILIHSSMKGYSKSLESIKNRNHRIIVCVNMLGEGFDMPELKIAALHDARQSLPVPLHIIGRFTRTSHDLNLGNASFVANIANAPTAAAIEDLYAQDADWNYLLPKKSDASTQAEIEFSEFVKSFRNIDDSKIPFDGIQFPLSCTLYTCTTNSWQPSKWKEAINPSNYEYLYSTEANDGNTFVLILGKINDIPWGHTNTVQNLEWNIVVVHRRITPNYKHIYVYSSSNDVDKRTLIEKIFNEKPELVSGESVFRVFDGLKRIKIPNFGGRKGRVGNLTYKAYYGKDVEEALSQTEQQQLIKNNIFGHGYRLGEKDSIGCSRKGKIWSFRRGNLLEYSKWCKLVGEKVEDKNIDPNALFKHTLKFGQFKKLPDGMPIAIDWDDHIIENYSVKGIYLRTNSQDFHIYDCDLILSESPNSNSINFKLEFEGMVTTYSIVYESNTEGFLTYKISQVDGAPVHLINGTDKILDLVEYFNDDDNCPVLYFSNGGVLTGNVYCIQNVNAASYDKELMRTYDWSGVDLSIESQDVERNPQSIQYKFAESIIDSFDYLIDDDGSGEIADLVGFKILNDKVVLHLFHLKYAKGGKIGADIGNLYELCGQAMKSLKWRENDRIPQLFQHFMNREENRVNKYGRNASRFLKGDISEFVSLRNIMSRKLPIEFKITLVQPGISKNKVSESICSLLGAVSAYIKDISNVDIDIVCSD